MSDQVTPLSTKTEKGPSSLLFTMVGKSKWGKRVLERPVAFPAFCLLCSWWKLQIGIGFLTQ